ncbi:glyceraldehyde-3-phosphate dehydrogenase [uncultured Kriegella sp.]|uniref:glyceraldehyde-3-phosphate dehydrogenase n=1 Tax=uncultured Kriegella sp. TaxID=1798910 RepID=UPI0030DAC802|tara:strand:+ start:397514 stop:398965 length:1452 start_codon:yes stop_codon:yes gene_type:complete
MGNNISYERELAFQADRRKATTEFIKITSDLWYDKSIEIVLFKNQIIDRNVSDIIQLHEYAGEFVQKPISIFDSVEILRAINDLDLPPSKLDIGKLTYEYHSDNDQNFADVKTFVIDKLKNANDTEVVHPKDVILYGFGRIGRVLARELLVKTGKGNQLRLRAIVTNDMVDEGVLEKSASLLRTDSVHGKLMGTIDIDVNRNSLIINGTTVYFLSAENPAALDYTKYGISDALVIDNSGVFRNKADLEMHLKSKGVSKVMLTAPGKEIPNIVHGVNHLDHDPETNKIFAAASCTTNAIAPILKVIEDSLGIIKGHLETIHAYTNDQNLIDNAHEKYRRERTATLNMAISATDAGDAVSKIIPSLKGKLTSNAIRVPISNGSLAILNLEVRNKTSLDGINTILKKYALEGDLVEQIKYSLKKEMVSSDINGTSAPAIYDSKATIISPNEKNVVLYIWYDNEYGYSHQVIRLAKHMAKVRRFTYN